MPLNNAKSAVNRGTLFVVSAPSGAGKRTVLKRVFERDSRLAYGVSATTRPPRPGEEEGKDYFFLTPEDFRQRIATGDFIEWAEVHGNLYGTPRSELERVLASGKDAVLELDVQGMRSLRSGMDLVAIFILPPSLEALESRLRGRGTNDEEDIQQRLRNAREEMAARDEYDYVVVNEAVDAAVNELERIIDARRATNAQR